MPEEGRKVREEDDVYWVDFRVEAANGTESNKEKVGGVIKSPPRRRPGLGTTWEYSRSPSQIGSRR